MHEIIFILRIFATIVLFAIQIGCVWGGAASIYCGFKIVVTGQSCKYCPTCWFSRKMRWKT